MAAARAGADMKIKRQEVPKIPIGVISFDDGVNSIFDAELDGSPCRWRCKLGTKKVIAFIRYAYDPQVERSRKDHPWRDAWFANEKSYAMK